jgi:hypothetical protein
MKHIASWIAEEYANGRTTSISAEEMVALAKRFLPAIFISDFDKAHEEAVRKAGMLAEYISGSEDVRSLDEERVEAFLAEVVARESSIQLLALTNLEGKRISQVHTQRGEKGMYRNLMNKDFRKHEWFVKVLESQEPYDSDLFFSKYTGRLIMTAARPIFDREGRLFAVMDIDFRFDELVKLINPLTDGLIERELAAFAPPLYADDDEGGIQAPGVTGCER